MSFYEYLKNHGYTEEKANAACILIENECPVDEGIEILYWTWCNNIILGKGDEI